MKNILISGASRGIGWALVQKYLQNGNRVFAVSRNISNFIEFATMQYLTSSQYVDNSEMAEILSDTSLVETLKQGLEEIKNNEFTIV